MYKMLVIKLTYVPKVCLCFYLQFTPIILCSFFENYNSEQLMSGPLVRVACPTNRLLNERTEYGRRMKRLSHRIFGEVTLQADKKTLRVAEIMASEPWEQQAKLSEKYYPNTPMFHYLVKMLKMHGLFFDEHLVWREVQNEIRIAKGKIIHPPIGAGKQKTKGKI